MTAEHPRAEGSPDEPNAKPRLPRNVIVLGVVSALNDMASEVAVRTIPLFLANVLSVGPALIGLVEGIAEAMATLLKLLSGVLSDRAGRRKPLVVLGFALSNLSKPLLYFAGTWGAILAIRFVDRVGKGIRTSPRDALLADSVPSAHRGRAFGFNRSMDPIGAIVGLAFAAGIVYSLGGQASLLDAHTYRYLVMLATVPAVLSVVVLVVGLRESPERTAQKKKFTLRGTLPGGLRRLLVAFFVFNLSYTSDAFLTLRAQELGLPLWATFSLIGLMNVILAFVSFPVGAWSDRVGRKRFLGAGWAIYAALLVGFAFAASTRHLAALFVLYGVHLGMTEGVEKALVTDLAPEESRATAFGYMQLAAGVAALPASLLTGVLWERFGSTFAFGVGGAIALASAALLALVPTSTHDGTEARLRSG